MPANKVAAATILGAVGSIALGLLSPAVAAAHGEHDGMDHAMPGAAQVQSQQIDISKLAPAKGKPVYLVADLDGKQEVKQPGKQVGDPDGRAQVLVEVKGNRITFSANWKNVSPLQAAHIHTGVANQDGGVVKELWSTPMPETVTAAAGQVVVDAKLAADITKNPAGFYVNFHSTEFKDGAVRGQLKRYNKRVNPMDIVQHGVASAFANGAQEVREQGKKVGDPNGLAIGFAQPQGANVNFAAAWVNIQSPSAMHAHENVVRQNGPVVFAYVTTPIPAGIFAVAGTVKNVEKGALERFKANPRGFYFNIHTAEFPDGAVRGQYR
jgi:hypothetical protein